MGCFFVRFSPFGKENRRLPFGWRGFFYFYALSVLEHKFLQRRVPYLVQLFFKVLFRRLVITRPQGVQNAQMPFLGGRKMIGPARRCGL
jgi:hypothetical protein